MSRDVLALLSGLGVIIVIILILRNSKAFTNIESTTVSGAGDFVGVLIGNQPTKGTH